MSETDKVGGQEQIQDQVEEPIEDELIEGELQKKYKLFAEKEQKIDFKLITKTSIKSEIAATLSEEEKVDTLVGLKIVHLEWLNIKKIQNLDVFTHLESLYLQYNQIEKIENLDMLINLEYLALNNNRIKRIENLDHLKKLSYLNLANNLIEDFDETELPNNLYMLKLQGNPCSKKSDYLTKIFKRIPELAELDAGPVSSVVRMVGLGQLPAHMLDYAKTTDEINQHDPEEEEGDEEEGEEDEEEDEEEEGDKESMLSSLRSMEEQLRNLEEQKSALSDDQFRSSTRSTAHSRAETDSFSLESKIGEAELGVLREKTEKILQRMKERYAQQLGDTMKEIQDTRTLHEEIIKIYKSQNTKK
jgi:Leucine-rich repeat (LRR) protein